MNKALMLLGVEQIILYILGMLKTYINCEWFYCLKSTGTFLKNYFKNV